VRITFRADNIVKEFEPLVKKELDFLQNTYQTEVKKRTPIDKGRARRGWNKRSQGRDRIVENKVPYIERLEGGYSKQAPRGFVKQALRATINKGKTK
jgi:hypothetical protein